MPAAFSRGRLRGKRITMSTILDEPRNALGPESAGWLMTPAEFDAIDEYDENYHYELIHGVLVVNSLPLPQETGPNEFLGYELLKYRYEHPQGKVLDNTLPQQHVRTRTGRRVADRLIWVGLGRMPNVRRDTATMVVEFVSAGRRNRRRDYVDKLQEYREAGISEYWIFDRFQRTLTVYHNTPDGSHDEIISEGQTYHPAKLPGFEVRLAEILRIADEQAQAE